MCFAATPLVLAQISTAASVVGAVTSIYGQQQMGKYQQQVANNNAIAAEYQAADAIQRGDIEADKLRTRVEGLKGQQRAALAANGVVLDEGTAANVVLDTVELGERDVLQIKNNAAREAWALRNQAQDFRNQGLLARSESNFNSASTLLTTVGSVADKWYQYKTRA